MRKRKKAEKEIEKIKNRIIEEGQNIEDFEAKKAEDIKAQQEIIDQCDKDMDYITYFPINHKYISIYSQNEMPPEVAAKVVKLRDIVAKQKHAKEMFKKREMKQADKEENPEVLDTKIVKETKEPEIDPFFVEGDAPVEDDEYKRIVDKTGKVIKVEEPGKAKEKKFERRHDNKFNKWNNDKPRNQKNFQRQSSKPKNEQNQPMKIKARSYRVSNVNLASEKKKSHVKF